eukprot:8169126-Heterocapsa_arctica.AAC.1
MRSARLHQSIAAGAVCASQNGYWRLGLAPGDVCVRATPLVPARPLERLMLVCIRMLCDVSSPPKAPGSCPARQSAAWV